MTAACLACGGGLCDEVFAVPDLPLVDSFELTSEQARKVPTHSISIAQCAKCLTLQVVSPPDTGDIYLNYIYESSSSPDLNAHFEKYAKFIRELPIAQKARVLEIGANDGLLLRHLNDLGYSNLTAVDPSPQTARLRVDLPQIRVVNEFFTWDSMRGEPRGQYDLIIANNCFSHIPSLTDTLQLCESLLSPTGILVVEVQSTLDLIQSLVFDFIYHEHYFYHTLASFSRVASMAGLQVFDVTHVPTKGGSYRFVVGRVGARQVRDSILYWEYRERIVNIHSHTTWGVMRDHLQHVKERLNHTLMDFRGEISAYGASATGTVLMRYMGLEQYISVIADDNEKRQGLFSPGSAIPVCSPEQLPESSLCVILAWRHGQKIAEKLRSRGISYLTPLPVLKINGQ
jgi:SAM-dependent methyltransferase